VWLDPISKAFSSAMPGPQKTKHQGEVIFVLLVELRGLEPLTFSLRRCPLLGMKSMTRVNQLMNR
jgi:hypothetical protein